jgi:hypothetical protein
MHRAYQALTLKLIIKLNAWFISYIYMKTFNKKVVKEALKESLAMENNPETGPPEISAKGQDSDISLLIHDIFGGEILKTPWKKGWHFYNRVDGERIDFTKAGKSKTTKFEDIPTTPDETCKYVVKEDYSRFFNRFIRVFEELVGLDKYRTGFST